MECIYNVSFDTHTNQCELEVQIIIHLQNLANQLPYAFIDIKKVTKSYIPTANTPVRIDVLKGQLANEYKIRLKREKPIGSKDITPRKRRTQMKIDTPKEVHDKQKAPVEAYDKQKAPEVVYDEQEALVEAYIEQKTLEEIRNKEITKRLRYLKIMRYQLVMCTMDINEIEMILLSIIFLPSKWP